MTLKELQEPHYIELEIESLQIQIIQMEAMLDIAQDVQKPRLRALIVRMEQRIKSLEERTERIQNAVLEHVTDEEIIRMIELFQQGKDWTFINKKIYGYADYQACRKRTERAVKDITF